MLNQVRTSFNRRILLVEDNVMNQTVALGHLERSGYRVDVASNGQESLDALARHRYDAVLMDCHMPVMDGYEATAAIRKREGTSRHTPIIALTAHVLYGDREKCLAAGMDAYINKSIRGEWLLASLESVLARRKLPTPPAVAATADQASPVDLSCLRDAASENHDRLKRIIALYVRNTRDRLEELRRAIKAGSPGDLSAIAHKSLGSSRTCGMIAIVPSLAELECIGKKGHLQGAADQLVSAQAAFEKIETFLAAYVNQLAA
jgi:two-component system, sensor histidine kinase and response regulator